MDENSAPEDVNEATPIFGAYRRGYDPDQVDRYVADQRRRLDEALSRASEAERRLAAAVGQLRELHRRVAVLESEERTQQAQPLDTLGERVQRILQEAWDGAYAIRQSVEQETNDVKSRAVAEAEEIVAAARRKSDAAEEEIARRRRAYLERMEQDRSRTASQMTYLHEQRTVALSELNRIKTLIEATVSEVDAGADPRRDQVIPREEILPAEVAADPEGETEGVRVLGPMDATVVAGASETELATQMEEEIEAAERADDELQETMPVHRLDLARPPESEADRARLVHSLRTGVPEATGEPESERYAEVEELDSARERRTRTGIFDFEAEEPE